MSWLRAGIVALSLVVPSFVVAEPLVLTFDNAEVRLGHNDEPGIFFTLSEASAEAFTELTTRNVGRRMDLRIDGTTVSSPVIREPIGGATGIISGEPESMDMAEVARQMATGEVVVEVEIVED